MPDRDHDPVPNNLTTTSDATLYQTSEHTMQEAENSPYAIGRVRLFSGRIKSHTVYFQIQIDIRFDLLRINQFWIR
jgi:hypothetical protein